MDAPGTVAGLGAEVRRGVAPGRHPCSRRESLTPTLPVVSVSTGPRDAARRPAAPTAPAPARARRPRCTRRSFSERATTCKKNGFTDAVIGLSGGVDSSLVAAIAVDALGAGHVHGLSMPSRYSSAGLGHRCRGPGAAPGDRAHQRAHRGRARRLHLGPHDRARRCLRPASPTRTSSHGSGGCVLMAVSNARGWIVLTTGNKSELATGYSTLVRRLGGRFRGDQGRPEDPRLPAVPVSQRPRGRGARPRVGVDEGAVGRVAPRPARRPEPAPLRGPRPAARGARAARPVDRRCRRQRIRPRARGRVASLVDGAEYKRRQSPPGVRITAKAFGKDRRMPITNRYRDPAPETTSGGLSGQAVTADVARNA